MHKDSLKDLLMFYSSAGEKLTTLSEYVDRMREDQKYIYFAAGESVQSISKLPQAEMVLSNGYEILYCTQEIDEFTLQTLHSYSDKEFKSVDSDDLGIETEAQKDENTESVDSALKFVRDALGDRVSEVIASKKLVSHPVCMTAKGSISFEMEKYFNAVQPESGMKAERCLELNMNHPAVQKMSELIGTDEEKAKKYAEIFYNQALLIAGLPIDDPSGYADIVSSIM
jgi:molecular chaperone HtpG